MEYAVIFTFGPETYCIKVLASTKEQAIVEGALQVSKDYRHFDSVTAVAFL